MSFWAVAQTIAERESAAGHRLALAGFDVLAPRAKLAVDGRVKIAALFPGYLFVRIIDQWSDARWCPGVLGLIMAGDQPARCPDGEIEKIMKARGRDGLVRLPIVAKTAMAHGQNVRILTGHFRGLNAVYQGMNARERVMILLDLLGRRVPVELAPDDRIEAS